MDSLQVRSLQCRAAPTHPQQQLSCRPWVQSLSSGGYDAVQQPGVSSNSTHRRASPLHHRKPPLCPTQHLAPNGTVFAHAEWPAPNKWLTSHTLRSNLRESFSPPLGPAQINKDGTISKGCVPESFSVVSIDEGTEGSLQSDKSCTSSEVLFLSVVCWSGLTHHNK